MVCWADIIELLVLTRQKLDRQCRHMHRVATLCSRLLSLSLGLQSLDRL